MQAPGLKQSEKELTGRNVPPHTQLFPRKMKGAPQGPRGHFHPSSTQGMLHREPPAREGIVLVPLPVTALSAPLQQMYSSVVAC